MIRPMNPAPLPAELLAAYRQAHYVVREPQIVIRVDAASPALDELLAHARRAAFVTAANPGSERLGDEENGRRLDELRAALEGAGRSWLEGDGHDPSGHWPAEPSVLVPGIAREAAAALARRFGQNAFVWCEAGRPAALVVVARWRLVLDTQVWLDWLVFADPSVAPLRRALAKDAAELYLDPPCEAELERVLAYPKIPGNTRQAERLAEARRMARRPRRSASEAERAALPRQRRPEAARARARRRSAPARDQGPGAARAGRALAVRHRPARRGGYAAWRLIEIKCRPICD